MLPGAALCNNGNEWIKADARILKLTAYMTDANRTITSTAWCITGTQISVFKTKYYVH